MVKKIQSTNQIMMIMAILTFAALFAHSAHVLAKQNIVAFEGASFTANASMNQNLKTFIGKKVRVALDSGQVISGIVKDVGDHMLHLEKLDGREFFDALIRIKDISAFESRFRKLQR